MSDLDDYQREAARTLIPGLDPTARLVETASGLAEEAGEALGLVRKHAFMGHPLDRARLTSELGDVLWCLAAVAGAAGISLAEVAEANLAKLRARYPDGYTDAQSRSRPDAR